MKRVSIYHSDPSILGGTPVFTGTRVPVDSLVDHLRHGISLSEFLEDFPSVKKKQAEAFLSLVLDDALQRTPQDAGAA